MLVAAERSRWSNVSMQVRARCSSHEALPETCKRIKHASTFGRRPRQSCRVFVYCHRHSVAKIREIIEVLETLVA